MMHPLNSFLIIFAAYLLTLGLTLVVKRVLTLDRPNKRSSHAVAVPRGGGLALMLIVIPAMALTAFLEHSFVPNRGLIVGASLLVLISWFDDKHDINIGLRLLVHLVAAYLGTFALVKHSMLFGGFLPFWLDRTLMIIGWAWFINLYNFMDGIDGITSVETIAIATGVCILFSAAGIESVFAGTLTLVLTGACLGFLAFNWHPAKVFLGDVGSVPLGYLTGYLLLVLWCKGLWAPALILPLYYIVDSGLTLIRRAMRGEKVWQAHCEHFYQRAAQRVKRHDRVVLWIVIANIDLIIAAAIAVDHPWAGLAFGLILVAVLMTKMHKSRG